MCEKSIKNILEKCCKLQLYINTEVAPKTISLLLATLSSHDSLCKQFQPRSGRTEQTQIKTDRTDPDQDPQNIGPDQAQRLCSTQLNTKFQQLIKTKI